VGTGGTHPTHSHCGGCLRAQATLLPVPSSLPSLPSSSSAPRCNSCHSSSDFNAEPTASTRLPFKCLLLLSLPTHLLLSPGPLSALSTAAVLAMSTSTWKPDTCPSLIPTLCIEGASAALAWYRKAYDAESTDVMHDQSNSKLLHACLALAGDGKFFLADPMPSMGFKPSVANLYLYVPDVDATFKKAVEAGATSKTEPVDQFWGDRTGQIEDPFGIRWTLATHKKTVAPADVEAEGRAWADKHAKETA
jgi:PhnB protein